MQLVFESFDVITDHGSSSSSSSSNSGSNVTEMSALAHLKRRINDLQEQIIACSTKVSDEKTEDSQRSLADALAIR
jgi:hypothetical protein